MNTTILLLCLCLPTAPYPPEVITAIPYQSKETTEIYGERHYQGIRSDSSLSYHYEKFDEIFILPVDYQGESELYDLGFYVDLDYTINTNWDANCYRIHYWFPDRYPNIESIQYQQVPEPCTLLLIIPSLLLLKRRKLTL